MGVPLFIMFFTWPIFKWIIEIEHAFEKSFGGGDLVLFSALLLIGVYVRLSHFQLSKELLRIDKKLDQTANVALALGFIMLFLYAIIKYDFVEYRFPPAEIDVARKIHVFAYFSIISTVFSVGFATYAMWQSIEKVLSCVAEDG